MIGLLFLALLQSFAAEPLKVEYIVLTHHEDHEADFLPKMAEPFFPDNFNPPWHNEANGERYPVLPFIPEIKTDLKDLSDRLTDPNEKVICRVNGMKIGAEILISELQFCLHMEKSSPEIFYKSDRVSGVGLLELSQILQERKNYFERGQSLDSDPILD